MITGGFIFMLGLIFGSFLNAWEYRIETKKSLGGRSFCPKCKKSIAWYDNIPVLSWIILRGKCRQCHKPISIQYPVVELLTGISFLGLWMYSPEGKAINNYLVSALGYQSADLQFPFSALVSLVILYTTFYILFLVALYDAKTKYVLSKYVYFAVAMGITYNLLNWNSINNLASYALAIIVPAGLFWALAHFSKERLMGAGDAEIAIAIGALLGWPLIMPAYYFAFIVGALYGVWILATRKGKLISEVPLGPFLVAGTLFAFIYGAQIVDWYMKLVFGM